MTDKINRKCQMDVCMTITGMENGIGELSSNFE